MKKDIPENKFVDKKDNNTIIVAIGASAGGLEALQTFFQNVPDNIKIAFVVIQHLSPDYKSLMDELLARYTNIKINIVKDGMKIKNNNVYLIPPRKKMTLFNNKLFLEEQDLKKGINLPIDIFFRSLAKEKGKNSIGIILSGTGSDGTLGIKAIKEAGGMIMVQDPEKAKFDGMPRSAISTGLVDYVLSTNKMPQELIKYIKHPFVKKTKALEEVLTKDIDVISKILIVLREYSGIDFSYYKENTIIRRLERRLSINQYNNLDDYFNFIVDSDKEKNILYRELLIGVTRFFRDEDSFIKLQNEIIPDIVAKSNNKDIRVWSAGASTGEEAYSLAISFLEYFEKNNIKKQLKIFATDIDKDSIEIASNGFYPESIISDIDKNFLNKYFTKKDNGYKANEELRKTVIFAKHNVLKDPPFSKIDLISCRNLFIYLKSNIQARVLSMFYFSLSENGYLMLGSSETIGEMAEAFKIVDSKLKIFKYKKGYSAFLPRNISLPRQTNIELEKNLGSKVQTLSSLKSDFLIEQVFNFFAPPSILIDKNNNIIQLINDVNKFLSFPKGRFTNELFRLVEEDLRVILTNIIRRLKTSEQFVIFKDVTKIPGFETKKIDIEGRRITEPKDKDIFFLISFRTKDIKTKDISPTVVKVDNQFKDKIVELERELQFTKENLQATVEELETSNEELQSSNEELIASNEELQSTNEELQSVNEELYTVNSEYQDKIQELTTLNADIQNLLNNTQIGTLYLDSKLCIRKFTPQVTKLTNIMEMDIGRPIHHMSISDHYPNFNKDIQKVQDQLKPVKKEIKDDKNQWHLITIMPYRTQDNAIDGIIITFVNITHLKETKRLASEIESRLQLALDIGEMAWWEYDIKTNIVTYDDKKATMLGYKPDEFPDDVYEITDLIHPDDYDKSMKAMKDHIDGKTSSYEAVYRIKTKNGAYRWFYDKGGIVAYCDNNKPYKVTGIVINIDTQKQINAQRLNNEIIINNLLENNPNAVTFVNKKGEIIFANKRAENLLGLTRKQIKERNYNHPDWEIKDINGNKIKPENLPFGIIKSQGIVIEDYKHYIIKSDNERILLSISGYPVYDKKHNFFGAIFYLNKNK